MLTPHHVSCVMCHVSHVRCQVSQYSLRNYYKVLQIVSGGSVINGADPSSFILISELPIKMKTFTLNFFLGTTYVIHKINNFQRWWGGVCYFVELYFFNTVFTCENITKRYNKSFAEHFLKTSGYQLLRFGSNM